LSWNGESPVPFDRTKLPAPDQLEELLRERRTTRFFATEKIDRKLVEEIVGYGVFAPTNNYALRAVIVDRPDLIQELDQCVMKFVRRIHALFFRPKLVFELLRRFTSAATLTDRQKVENDVRAGRTTGHPAATVFIVGDRRIALSEDSAQYALYNMILFAHVSGIGTRLRGPGPIILDRSKPARKLLGLGKHDHILGMLEIGHPEILFANKVSGKRLPVQWIDGP
jgi:nitroreductase